MDEVITKQKLSCLNGYNQIQKGDLSQFIKEGKIMFGIKKKHNLEKKMTRASLSQIEIEGFERLFKKFGVTENIWSDVD